MKILHCFSISYSFSFVSVTSSSCAALRAVDLGSSSLDTFRARSFGGFPMSCYASGTQLESGELPWERAHFPSKTLFWPQLTFVKKWSFFVIDRGPQQTFLKKWSFFVTDGGPHPNWPFRCLNYNFDHDCMIFWIPSWILSAQDDAQYKVFTQVKPT